MTSHTATRHAHPLTRSPLAARPLLLLLLLLTLITSLAVAHVERETLWDTGDHHDRQCFKQVIIRRPRGSGLSKPIRIMRLISSVRPVRAVACRARSGLDKPIKQTLKSQHAHRRWLALFRQRRAVGAKLTTVAAHLEVQGSRRYGPCLAMHASHQAEPASPSQLTFRLPVEILV